MSENGKQISCSVCKAYLFDDDDVVYCPVCGAPHHRDCYNSIGHCAFDEYHGTDKEYKKPDLKSTELKNEPKKDEKITCDMCGNVYDGKFPVCPKCGYADFKNVTGFGFQSTIPEDMDLGDGVKAGEAGRFVFTNAGRYIPKFAEMKLGKKAGWNWFSFLFPCGWFLSRKMYTAGIITGILSICFSMLTVPFQQAISHYDIASLGGYPGLISAIASDYSKIGFSVLVFSAVGAFLQVILRFICAIFGDRIYRNHAISTIKDIKANSADIDYDYRKRGGTSFFLLLIGFFAVQYIPAIIASFIK